MPKDIMKRLFFACIFYKMFETAKKTYKSKYLYKLFC